MSGDDSRFDVLVVGGGHAGLEAALAADRAGARVLLLTQNIDTLGQMSCNPAVGGVGKGHLVKEIDALGGAMGVAADRAGIQCRRLNASRGLAVRATRAQADRALYRAAARRLFESSAAAVVQQTVADILLRGDEARGVRTNLGAEFFAPAVVLTAGTFLNGAIHIGRERAAGGRAGCPAAGVLAARLRELGAPVGRLKTGTPPRIDGRTIDFSRLDAQAGDSPAPHFSFLGAPQPRPPQTRCWLARTNEKAHDIARAALADSPLFSGAIQSGGPRYCPSLEDKVTRFAERDSHPVVLEPEGLETAEFYPNGISTSLPFAAQQAVVRAIDGLQNARITRPGYAIEYDYFDPRALDRSLQTRLLRGLFFAGQINGTTGYEEAAAQGLVAGLNAARFARDLPPHIFRRADSYIGVLVDDLTVRGVSEPYRMFTSRAEHRLRLREDNADFRLTPVGRELGIVDDARWASFCERRGRIESALVALDDSALIARARENPRAQIVVAQAKPGDSPADCLRRPPVHYADLEAADAAPPLPRADGEEIEARIKYAGYIARQEREIEARRGFERTPIPPAFDYATVPGLSVEARDLLARARPADIGQAAQIGGVTPDAVSQILIWLRKQAAPRDAR